MIEIVIELWDSLGEQTNNNEFLRVAECFIKDLMSKETAEGRVMEGAQWQQGWTREDKSQDSPRQTNEHDCGVFTLTSMGLLRSGLRLTKDAYSWGGNITERFKEDTGMENMGSGSW